MKALKQFGVAILLLLLPRLITDRRPDSVLRIHTQWEFIQDVASMIHFAQSRGDVLTGGEMERPQRQQDYYFSTGASRTKDSYHTKKLAWDFSLFVNDELTYRTEDLRPYGEYWESLHPNNKWGGNFEGFMDAGHVERRLE